MLQPCPHCGAQAKQEGQLLCRVDWYRLPAEIRTAVWSAYRRTGPYSPAYALVARTALKWLRDNDK